MTEDALRGIEERAQAAVGAGRFFREGTAINVLVVKDAPALCAEVRRLRQALEQYADEDHWAYRTGDYTTPLDLWVGPEKAGPRIAREALGQTEATRK